MSYKIDEIEGIGPANAAKLAAANITTTDDLLDKCCTPAGRKDVAENTGVGESTILKWSNMADLMRVSGIGRQFSELLKAAGVDHQGTANPERGQPGRRHGEGQQREKAGSHFSSRGHCHQMDRCRQEDGSENDLLILGLVDKAGMEWGTRFQIRSRVPNKKGGRNPTKILHRGR